MKLLQQPHNNWKFPSFAFFAVFILLLLLLSEGPVESSSEEISSGSSVKKQKDVDKEEESTEAVKRKEKEKSKLSEFWTEDSKSFNLAIENGSEFTKKSDDYLVLKSGTFLIESEGNIQVELPMSKVQLRPKSILLIRLSKGSERFYCLIESALLTTESKTITLHCGEECFLADHMPRSSEITGEFEVGVRQPRGEDISPNRKIATMEFSIIQAMEREPLLSQVSHSKHNHDRLLRDKLLKAVAILNMLTNRRGAYGHLGN